MLGASDAEAEDIVQETFVRAHRALHRMGKDGGARIWLHRIAVNVIRTCAPPRRPDASVPALDGTTSEGNLDLASSRRLVIDRALATLPEDDRLLVALRDMQGFENHEIAAITGLPNAEIASHIFDARRQLRPLLEPLIRRGAWIVP